MFRSALILCAAIRFYRPSLYPNNLFQMRFSRLILSQREAEFARYSGNPFLAAREIYLSYRPIFLIIAMLMSLQINYTFLEFFWILMIGFRETFPIWEISAFVMAFFAEVL